jgi:hypothetical protein
MKPWPATIWTDSGQIMTLMGDAVDAADMADKFHLTPDKFFDLLLAGKRLSEATFFIGHALPRYEGIVWALQSLLQADALDRSSPLVNAILRWIDGPNDELRRDIQAMGDAEDDFTPAAMLGMAVFMSGGSISEPDLPPVLAPDGASARLAAGAVLTAAYATPQPHAMLLQAAQIGVAMASQSRG